TAPPPAWTGPAAPPTPAPTATTPPPPGQPPRPRRAPPRPDDPARLPPAPADRTRPPPLTSTPNQSGADPKADDHQRTRPPNGPPRCVSPGRGDTSGPIPQ